MAISCNHSVAFIDCASGLLVRQLHHPFADVARYCPFLVGPLLLLLVADVKLLMLPCGATSPTFSAAATHLFECLLFFTEQHQQLRIALVLRSKVGFAASSWLELRLVLRLGRNSYQVLHVERC